MTAASYETGLLGPVGSVSLKLGEIEMLSSDTLIMNCSKSQLNRSAKPVIHQ